MHVTITYVVPRIEASISASDPFVQRIPYGGPTGIRYSSERRTYNTEVKKTSVQAATICSMAYLGCTYCLILLPWGPFLTLFLGQC